MVILLLALLLVTAGGPAVAAPLFRDAAAACGLDFHHFNGMSGELYFAEMMGSGAALVDYDGDGDLDAFLVQGAMLGRDKTIADATFPPLHPPPLTDRLYRNDLAPGPDGTLEPHFTDVTAAAGLTASGYGMGVAAGDYDNDGFPDLYVTRFGPNQLLHNEGDGTFRDVTAASGTGDDYWGVSAAFFDYDRDGWLDLYVGNYVDFRLATHKACVSATGALDYCSPLAYQPEADRLFHNRGDGTFEEVSGRAGTAAEYGGALGVVTGDFDGDGWVDVYVANDGLPNQLWINRHDGTFSNEALLGGCAVNEEGQPQASMGVVVGDIDGNGADDLFMSHLTRETNTLYLNDGHGYFEDASRSSGLGSPSWGFTGFGTALFDYDLDGWLDLLVANGAVIQIEEQAAAGDPYPLHQTNQLFHNLGQGRFEEVSAAAGEVFALSEVSRGLAVGDVDNDGDPDVLMSNNNGPARLLLNSSADAGERAWLGVRLVDAGSGRDLLGSRVTVPRPAGPRLSRRVATDGSYASAQDPRVLLGLGGDPAVERLELRPLGGVPVTWRSLPSGRYLLFALPRTGERR